MKEFYDIELDQDGDLVIDNAAGDFARLGRENALKQAIKEVLSTPPGDNIFHPEIGSSISKYIQADINKLNIMSMKKDVKNTLKFFKNEIDLDSVKITITDFDSASKKISFLINFDTKFGSNLSTVIKI